MDEPLSRDEFVRFLVGVHPGKFQCSFCGHASFAINAGVEENAVATLVINAQIQNRVALGNGHTFHSVSCSNCGNSLFFHETAVRKWLSDQPIPESVG